MGAAPPASPWRIFAKLIAFAGLVLLLNWGTALLLEHLEFEIRPSNEPMIHRLIMLSSLLYMALLAVPFVPGVEIGLALIGMLGPDIVPLVYACTLIGLTIAFLVGRLLPLSVLTRIASFFHLTRAAGLLRSLESMTAEERLALMINESPGRFLPFLARHRYIALALAVNLPGNFLIGGGGGIAMIAGLSRLFPLPAYLATVALAVSPVPLLVLFFGTSVLGG